MRSTLLVTVCISIIFCCAALSIPHGQKALEKNIGKALLKGKGAHQPQKVDQDSVKKVSLEWTDKFQGGPLVLGQAPVVVGDTVYSFGGDNGGEFGIDFMRVYALNTTTNTWTTIQDGKPIEGLSPPLLGKTAAVAYGDYVYVWGGIISFEKSRTLYRFNLETYEWDAPEQKGTIPSARFSHSLVLNGGKVYLFGGADSDGDYNDLYVLDLETTTWTEIVATGDRPSPRSDHAATFHDGKLFIFGGGALNGLNISVSNELFSFDIARNEWTLAKTSGVTPGALFYPAFASLNGALYVTGGEDTDSSEYFINVLKFDPATNEWEEIISTGEVPPSTILSRSIFAGNKMILFGGYQFDWPVYYLDTTYVLTVTEEKPMEWSENFEGGPLVLAQSPVTIGDTVYSFGGDSGGESGYYVMRVFALNTTTNTWTTIQDGKPTEAFAPPLLGKSVAVAHGDYVYVWGGTAGFDLSNTLYRFNLETSEWDEPEQKGDIPSPRFGPSAAQNGSKVYVFGGWSDDDGDYNDLYVLDLETTTWTEIVATGDRPSARSDHTSTFYDGKVYVYGGGALNGLNISVSNEVFSFDFERNEWTLAITSGIKPYGLFYPSVAAHNGALYVTGGEDVDSLDYFLNVLKFDLATNEWEEIIPEGEGPPNTIQSHSAFAGNKMFFFGGYRFDWPPYYLETTYVLNV